MEPSTPNHTHATSAVVQPTIALKPKRSPRKKTTTAEDQPIAKKAAPQTIIREQVSYSSSRLSNYVDSIKSSFFIGLQRVMDMTQDLRNASIGALLVFLSNLPIFFEPVLFVMNHTKMLSRALLHVVGPLALAWYAAQTSPVLREYLFSSEFFAVKIMGAAALFIFTCLTWMFAWLSARHIFNSASSMVQQFADVGANHTVSIEMK
jgi:hypothetical protein